MQLSKLEILCDALMSFRHKLILSRGVNRKHQQYEGKRSRQQTGRKESGLALKIICKFTRKQRPVFPRPVFPLPDPAGIPVTGRADE